MAVAAPLIAPQDPYDLAHLVLIDARRPPGFVGCNGYTHWLGTDAQGRDLLSAILYGLRISIQVGILAGAIAFGVGVAMGTLRRLSAAGAVETVIMRIIDLQLSFPAILLALVLRHCSAREMRHWSRRWSRRSTPTSRAPRMAPPRPSVARTTSRRRFRYRCRPAPCFGGTFCPIACRR